jgi:hypothetical protein
MLDGPLALVAYLLAAARRQAPGQLRQRNLLALPTHEASAVGPDQEGVPGRLPGAVLNQGIRLAVDDVDQRTTQAGAGDRLHARQNLVDAVGLLARGRRTGAEDRLGCAQAQLQGGNRLTVVALDQQQGGQLVAAAVVDLGLVGLAPVAGIAQQGPVVDDQAPGLRGLAAPQTADLVKRLDEAGQGDGVVVQEAVSAKDSGEAVGQSGDSQGMDAGGQRVAHMQVLHDELAVAQLEPGLQRGCKDSMLSFYALTCDKSYGRCPGHAGHSSVRLRQKPQERLGYKPVCSPPGKRGPDSFLCLFRPFRLYR